jgi:predicted AAA+ superfamily ATPase
MRNMQFSVLNGEIDINEGALTENYVACALASKGVSLHYYDRKSKQELDFIVSDHGGVAIIEVKSGDAYKKHSSLDSARSNFADKITRSIVLSKFNVESENGITYLPLYMTDFISL